MEGYIAEIRLFAATFAPRNWAYCAGQTISIAQNSALFSLLGTTYGGDGIQTFRLPDFRSRQARGAGQGPGLSMVSLGEVSGFENITLSIQNLPSHTHTAVVKSSSNTSNTTNPINGSYGPTQVQVQSPPGITATGNMYAATSNVTMAADMVEVQSAGFGSPLSLTNPYLAMNYVICMYGIYPSRS